MGRGRAGNNDVRICNWNTFCEAPVKKHSPQNKWESHLYIIRFYEKIRKPLMKTFSVY